MINSFSFGKLITLEGTVVDFSIKLLDNLLTFKTDAVINYPAGLNNASSSISPNFVTSLVVDFPITVKEGAGAFLTNNVVDFPIAVKEGAGAFLTNNVVDFSVSLKRV